MNTFESKENSMMYWYLKMCCSYDFLKILESFTHGIGYGLGETMLVFSDDPDENAPYQEREFPELEGFDGVEFYSEHYPEPLFLSYQEFYDNLKEVVIKFISDKSLDYQKQAIIYLEAIKSRYNLK